MPSLSPDAGVHACVLAAGTSKRFGATKLIQPFRGKPLLQHVLEASQAACPGRVTLVVGHDAELVKNEAGPRVNAVIRNEGFVDGIGSSIAAAARHFRTDRERAQAIIIVLADQPLLDDKHLLNMIEKWRTRRDDIIASTFAATDCPPILFPRQVFGDLCKLDGDSGAKHLLSDPRYRVQRIENAALQYDIDTPEDLQALT